MLRIMRSWDISWSGNTYSFCGLLLHSSYYNRDAWFVHTWVAWLERVYCKQPSAAKTVRLKLRYTLTDPRDAGESLSFGVNSLLKDMSGIMVVLTMMRMCCNCAPIVSIKTKSDIHEDLFLISTSVRRSTKDYENARPCAVPAWDHARLQDIPKRKKKSVWK